MDIDTIISELDRVLHYRGREGLVEAAARAPKLLKQDRYRDADDARESLAVDIRAAIAQLPKDVQVAANGLLPIDEPNAFLNHRQRSLGIGGYSPTAVRWHRTAVLGRVAAELAKLFAPTQPSYRILDLDVNVWQHSYTVGVGVGPTTRSRIIEFRWTIESLVSDLCWFAFSCATPPRLKFFELRNHMPGDGAAVFRDLLPRVKEYDWDWIPQAGDSDHIPWYLLRLSDTPPTGVPIALYVRLIFHKADKGAARFDYMPTVPLKRLSLSFTHGNTGERRCIELDETASKVLRTFTGKSLSRIEEDEEGEIISEESSERFRVRSPRVGRYYRLEW
jgi:hypothetical protein